MQALLKMQVTRAASTASAAQSVAGGTGTGGLNRTRRAEHNAAALLLARAGRVGRVSTVAGLNRTRLVALTRRLGCSDERWEGPGWCTPSSPASE